MRRTIFISNRQGCKKNRFENVNNVTQQQYLPEASSTLQSVVLDSLPDEVASSFLQLTRARSTWIVERTGFPCEKVHGSRQPTSNPCCHHETLQEQAGGAHLYIYFHCLIGIRGVRQICNEFFIS